MSKIHNIEYHRERMDKREVETILAELAQERAQTASEIIDSYKEVRQNKQNRHHQINKNITETHVEKLSHGVNTFVGGAQILSAFAAAQSPLANFINGLAQVGNATSRYTDSVKQFKQQTLNHDYQGLGGLLQEGKEDIRQKMDHFRQAMQDKHQAEQGVDRIAQAIFSN